MFFFKKCIGFLLAPETVILVLLSYGLLKLIFQGKSKCYGVIWIFLGIICFLIFSTAPLPSFLLYPLESRYQPLKQVQNPSEINYIVVLSGDLRHIPDAPPTSRLGATTASRVIEGIRLFHLFQTQPILIMSGGGPFPVSRDMVAFARSLGVPADKLIVEAQSPDTYGNAREVKAIVKDSPFVLVTSASHLPRTMIIFQTLGMRPIPAPADFNVPESYILSDFFPSGRYLTKMSAAVHEYLGLAYLKLFPQRVGK
jgi:uncharacterized SAM-binding protein YcdF (DUF218 family)